MERAMKRLRTGGGRGGIGEEEGGISGGISGDGD